MSEVIALKNLNVSYGAVEVLQNINLSVAAGDYIGLTGPNGSGKTTLIKTVLGLIGHNNGNIEILGKKVRHFSEWDKIGYLPQRVTSFNPLFPATVKEVVALGLLSHKQYPKRFSREDEDKITQKLALLDIVKLKDQPVSELSGGQQQRVFLARALVSDPEILILDEPSTALDPQTREKFFELIKQLNATRGTTVVLITHDLGHIGRYATKLLYLDKKIVFFGTFGDFCASGEMSKYFGEFSQHLICHQHN
jgi:zinc transport system ATP-binding protein